MAVVVVLSGLLLAGCGAANLRLWRALRPRTVLRQVAACLVVSVLLTYTGLMLLAAPALAGLRPHPGLLAMCRRLLIGPGPLGTLGTCAAASLVAVSLASLVMRMWRSRRDRRDLRIEFGLGHHEPRPGYDLVTLPSHVPLAYSLGGRHPQVVVSHGLRSRLGERELAAVVAHEAAHLRGRHDRWLALASLLETALWFAPWARPTLATLRLALERWADDEAAGAVGRKALRAALVVTATAGAAPLPSQVAALTSDDGLATRLALLSDEAARPAGGPAGAGWSWYAVSVAAVGTAGAGVIASLATLAHVCAF